MKKPIVICVDDEPMVLESLKVELTISLRDKCLIETADSGQEALELISELQKDGYEIATIISDYLMPTMKGDELLKEVHIILPQALKIMLTGQADLEAVGNAIKYARLYRYIAKPWQTNDLKLTVSEAVHSYLQTKKVNEQNKILKSMYKALEKSFDQLAQLNKAYIRFVPNEYLNLYKRYQIAGDFWMSFVQVTGRKITTQIISDYKEIALQAIYPYLTSKGKLEFKSFYASK